VSKSLLELNDGNKALTTASSLVGSPLYMSPEQLECARDVDVRADIWALGVVLYELLMGEPPFQGDTIPQLVAAVLQDAPVRPLDDSMPAELAEVVQRALAKRRVERFASVAEFAQALGPFAPSLGRTAITRVRRLLEARSPTLPHEPDAGHAAHRPGSQGRSVTPIQEAKSAAESAIGAGSGNKALWIGVALGMVVALLVLVLRHAAIERDANQDSRAAEVPPAPPTPRAAKQEGHPERSPVAPQVQAGANASPTLGVVQATQDVSTARPLAGAQSNVVEPAPTLWPKAAQDEAQAPAKQAPRARAKQPPSAAEAVRARVSVPEVPERKPDPAAASRITDFGGRR
jgi:hypothetical protein